MTWCSQTRDVLVDETSEKFDDTGYLSSFIIRVKVLREIATNRFSGPLVGDFLSSIFPSLAQYPVRVSPLNGPIEVDEEHNCVYFLKGESYWFRICSLNIEAEARIQKIMRRLVRRPRTVSVNNGALQVEGLITETDFKNSFENKNSRFTHPGQMKWIRRDSLADIKKRCLAVNTINFNFQTPTAIRNSGKLKLFPEPKILFHDLGNAVNRLNDQFLAEPLSDSILDKVEISSYDLQLQTDLPDSTAGKGFTGKCSYDLSNCAEEEKVLLNMLSLTGFYTGVGEAVEVGMGQYWVLN